MRSQCPRAWHSGLMHCTVHPGKYCIVSPSRQSGQVFPCGRESWQDCASEGLVCQGEIPQLVVVALPRPQRLPWARRRGRVESPGTRFFPRIAMEANMTISGKDSGDSPVFRMSRVQNLIPRRLGGILTAVVLLILAWISVTSVPTGNVGVLPLFGRVTGEILPEGIHLINPLKSVNKLSVQTQSIKETANVPSNEGLILALDSTLLFRLDRGKAAQVLQTMGTEDKYINNVVEPTLRAAIRSATSAHTANALYTSARELVAKQIQEELVTELGTRGFIVESVLLRDVQLPPLLKSSIEAKQQAEQDALRMSFVLQKEKQEAERKRIEAQGIADFQRIVAQGISPQLLEWKGIEATEKLATSQNAKVVLIGNSKTGLPLILEPR